MCTAHEVLHTTHVFTLGYTCVHLDRSTFHKTRIEETKIQSSAVLLCSKLYTLVAPILPHSFTSTKLFIAETGTQNY